MKSFKSKLIKFLRCSVFQLARSKRPTELAVPGLHFQQQAFRHIQNIEPQEKSRVRKQQRKHIRRKDISRRSNRRLRRASCHSRAAGSRSDDRGHKFLHRFCTKDDHELFELRVEFLRHPRANDSESDGKFRPIVDHTELVRDFRAKVAAESEFLEVMIYCAAGTLV